VPAIQCPAHLRMSKTPQLCDLPGSDLHKTHGLCCTSKQNHTANDMKKLTTSNLRSSEGNEIFHEATHEFDAIMHDQVHQPKPSPQKVTDFRPTEPDFFHQMVFGNHRPNDAVEVNALVNSGAILTLISIR
jgi:hypothetical protein